MDLITLIVLVAIAVIAFIVIYWLLQQVTLDPKIRQIITIVLVVAVAVIAIIILLRFAGMSSVRIP